MTKLMCAVAETFPTFIVKHMNDALVQAFVALLLRIIAYPGHYGVDQEVSDLPLQTFYLVQETLADPPATEWASGTGDVPSTLSTNSSTDSIVDLANDDSVDRGQDTHTVQLPASIEAVARDIFTQLLLTLCNKAQWPCDGVWQSWPPDRREKWTNFRRDVADTLLVCYYVLREQALKTLSELLVATLNAPGRSAANWQVRLMLAQAADWG